MKTLLEPTSKRRRAGSNRNDNRYAEVMVVSSRASSFSTFFSLYNPRLIAALVWLSLLVGGAYLYIFEPGKSGFFPPCPFRTLTGLNCPGCGTTRCLHQLLHGEVVNAFELNPLFMVMLPFGIWFLVRYTWAALTGRKLRAIEMKPGYVWPVVGLIVGFWIFRNTSMYPFHL